MAIALSALRTIVRQRTGFESVTTGGADSVVTDSELNGYLNQSLAELHDVLTMRFEDYYTLSTTSTVAAGANTIALPSNFNKLRRLQYQLETNRWARVPRFEMDEMEQANGLPTGSAMNTRERMYRIIGSSVYLLPEDGADGTYRLWYTTKYTLLSADADTWDDPQGWYEYAIVDACAKCLVKEESDPSAFMAQKAALLSRIEAAATNRDAGSPGRVVDVRWGRGGRGGGYDESGGWW